MANFDLNLPLDIPWRRIAVTEDMIDRRAGDREFPHRWQTSVSVFDYEPDEEYQNYEGMIVSYLKVTCSITGFQPRGDEVGLQHSAARVGSDRLEDGDLLIDRDRWDDTRVIKAYKEAIEDYYGCYGAVLEVTVAPGRAGSDIPSDRYPFFIDFEPKKRELYEVVTETGEAMSRSLHGLNVRKGSTTTEAHEVLDIFGGVNVNASVAGTGGGVGVQGQWGTKDLNQTEYVDTRTTDAAREKRETFSHTTQLSQMYHQLNSYHLGTNRAVFYVLPRPHIVQLSSDDPSEIDRSTFVDGPRLLEGVQEFFLVVLRPDDIRELCVEAYLETAHVFQEKVPVYRRADPLVDEFVVNGSLNEREGETERISNEDDAKSFLERVGDAAGAGAVGFAFGGPIGAAIGALFGAAWNEAFGDTLDKTTMTAITRVLTPSSTDVEFDVSRGTQATAVPVGERKQYIGAEFLLDTLTPDQATAIGTVYSQKFTENTFFFDTGTRREIGQATIRVEVPQRRREPDMVNGDKALFLTGRGVSSCRRRPDRPWNPGLEEPTITWEGRDDDYPVPAADRTQPTGPTFGMMTRKEANAAGERIRSALRKAASASDRRPRGTVKFAESDFFARYVSKTADGTPAVRRAVSALDGLDDKLKAKLAKSGFRLSRSDVLEADMGLLAARLDLTLDEVLSLRRASLGLVTAAEAADIQPPDPHPEIRVPDLTGLTAGEAARAAEAVGLRLGERRTVDDERPRGHVLEQKPGKGAKARKGDAVDITLSSGLSVRLPDLVGMKLGAALVALERAGLACLPEIEFEHGCAKDSEGRVLKADPEGRSFILPHASVRLVVASCEPSGAKGATAG